jgi:hypothetical protein
MGGSRDPEIHAESNLLTLCRDCHRKVHQGPWALEHSGEGIRVLDRHTGEQVMRRLYDSELDVPGLFEQLNQVEEFLSRLSQSLPYLADDQLVEAFAYASSYGKRSWLIQAAVLYEAQQRSIYGDQALEAIARRFEISLRQAQKYALAWKTFFDQDKLPENVNIDVFLLDQPSWYVVAATETEHPHRWLAYAQDRKIGDPKYSISTFRQDIRQAKEANLIPSVNEGAPDVGLPRLGDPRCPWVKEFCVASGNPVPLSDCQACEFQKTKNCETKPILEEV